MTLIASFVLHGCPVVIGDLLLSRRSANHAVDIQVPAVLDINPKLADSHKISVAGLRQKVNLISDNFCVAWTGSYIQARAHMRYLREETQGQIINEERYNEILDAYPVEDMRDLEVLTYLYDHDKKRFSRRNRNLPHFELGLAVDVQLGGSGTEEFVRQFPSMEEAAFSGEAHPLSQAVGRAAMLCNSFWGMEAFLGGGLGQGWGGGFEIAFFRRGKFEKLSNILYFYWEARQLPQGGFELELLPRFMKVDYIGTQMRIFLSDGSGGEFKDSVFVVGPMFDDATNVDATMRVISYEWLNSFVRVELVDGSAEFLSTVNRFGGEFRPVRIQTAANTYEMAFHDGYVQQLTNAIAARLAQKS